MVSGTLSLPCTGCFSPFPHGTCSLSVSHEYLALPDGPGGFTQDFTCPALLRMPLTVPSLRIPGCHRLRRRFPGASARNMHRLMSGPTTPQGPEPLRFGLFPSRSPLLGESLLFSFPAGTKMFQFPAFASVISTYGCQVFNLTGFPIRTSAGQRSFAPHRSFSQLITSFIACGSLGIRHTPFSSFSYFVDMSHTHIIYKEGDTLSILSVLIPCHKKGRVRFTFAFLFFLYHYVKDRVRHLGRKSGE